MLTIRKIMLSVFFLILPICFSQAAPLKFGATAENWSLENNKGDVVDYYKDSEDKVSVILFWATWCPYCKTLMPHLDVLNRKYRNKGLKFYAINFKEDGEINPVEYFEGRKFTYTQLLNGDEVAASYGVKSTPAVYVIDKDKKVIYKRPSGVSDVLVKQNVDLKIRQALSK